MLLTAANASNAFALLLLAAFPAGVIVAAMKDATSFTIPNWIPLALVGAFAPAALVVHLSMGALGMSLIAGVIALLCGMGMFAMGWCGGGDAKLMAAAALWLGWSGVLPFLAVTGLAGGALALALMSARNGTLAAYASGAPTWARRLFTPGEDLPYGLAIAAGALAAFPSSALLSALAAS